MVTLYLSHKGAEIKEHDENDALGKKEDREFGEPGISTKNLGLCRLSLM